MQRILVAGGDGHLGSRIVKELENRSQTVRVMSRKTPLENMSRTYEWAQADVITGDGVDTALQDVDIIVNCLSSPVQHTYETDILGTRRLLAQAKKMGVRYVVHISILGIDRIIYPYYQYKLGAELTVVESGVPYLIARIAQFHSYVDYLLSPLRDIEADEVSIPVDVQFQSIDTGDIAAHLAPHIVSGDVVGRLADFGGPEVLTLRDMTAAWLEVQGIRRSIKAATEFDNDLPVFDAFGDGLVNGYNTAPDNRVEGIRWHTYLQQVYNRK
jgi:uncharacterized protein YbjT (DUF2867 family)